MVILTCINGVLPEYLMGGHIDNNPPKSLLEKTESSPNLARTAQLDDLDLDFVTEESTVALSTSDDEETPRYHVPYPFAFNGGKPFSLEKDPITGKIDFEKPVKALNYTNHYQELNEDEQIKDFSKGNSSYLMKKKMENKEIEDVSPNEINPYSPNFHDFLNLPIHYSFGKYDKDKYPLISNSYANTKVQSGSNSYSIYNHKPYHGESIMYYSTKKPYMSKATSITTMTTTMTTLKPTSSITPNTITISTTSKPIITSTPMTTPIIATTTTTTSPPTTTSTSMKLPVVTTWKPSISTPKRFVDYLEDYDDILPIEKLQSSMYSNNHQGSNNIVHHNRDSQTKPSIKHEEYINNYEDYEIEEDEEEIKDYVSMKETTNKVIRTSTLPTTTSISNITIITEKNPEIIPMTTTIINTSVPSSSAIHLSSVSQESILQNNSLPFQVPYLRTVTSMPLDNEYMSFENDNRKHDIADDIIMNQEYHPNTIINKKPTGEIFVESTSNILIPPDQDIVSFVLGNRQNVEGGYYSLGTAIGENPYSSSTKLDSSFRPLYNTSPNKSNYDSQTDFQEIIGLPLISALENNYTYAQWRQPNPIETQKLANEIEPPRTQNSFIKDTVFLEESENKKNDKNINHIVFPKDKPKQSVEDHIIVINEANEVKSSSTTLKPSTTLKMDPLISNEEHLPQLSENLTPPAEQPKLPSQFYYHYNYGGFTVKPDHLRLQRLPSRGKSPSSSPTLPSEFIGIRRRPYSPDSTLPNILPQFRPNAKTSHGHRGSEIIGTIPAGQTYPTRVRQSVQSYPSTRRPLLPVPFYLQRLNPPPPPIHAVRFATKIDNLISSRDTDSIVKRFHLPLISVTSRAEDIKLAHRLTNQKLRLEDEERSEHYSEEPPQLPPKPPLFPKRRIAHSPHVATLQMIQQHREFEEDITESNLPMNVPNTDDESDRIIIDQNADGRKLENHETMVESPVYVVYPVNTAVNIHPDDSREKDESVVVGTRGPHRPLPPETLLQDNENQQEMNQEIKSSVHNIFNRRPIMSDFPYPLERPDPSILINGMRETPLLVPSDQRQEENPVQENTEEKDEKDSNVNIIPYLQDFIPFPPKKNDVISATLHRLPALSSSTPIAYVYTPTVQSSHGLDVDMRDEKNSEIDKNQKLILLPSQQPSSSSSSAPSPQNFMPPFVASISAETSSKNGWSVVAMESTINRKSDDNSSEATLNVKEIQTEKTEFDAENFKPQMFGGFKPIYEFPTQNENHSEYKESNDLKTEVNTYAHESANSTV